MAVIKPIDTRLETALLKSLQKKENYESYIAYVNLKNVLPTTKIVLKNYKRYFENYPEASEIDFGLFYTHFTQDWETLNTEDAEYYRDYMFPAVLECEEQSVSGVIEGLKKKQVLEKLSEMIASGDSIENIKEFVEKNNTSTSVDSDEHVYTSDNLDLGELDKANGIPWFLPTLQKSLMSITAGQFIVVAADSNTGKSAFVISQAVHAFKWLHKQKDERPILYFNSEGTAADVLGRFFSNLYKSKIVGGFEEVVNRKDEVQKKFKEAFNAQQFKILQVNDFPTFKQIKAKVEQYQPALVIIDICDKVANGETVEALKTLYDNLRVLASGVCPVVGTSQSGDTSYWDEEAKQKKNKIWLTQKDCYGSKTGKAGAADSFIGIGAEEGSNLRYISIAKQKRGEPVKLVCEIEREYSNYKEVSY
jgi:KaiC/GvpD/RAD55 family RecA-like ATPase